LRAFDNGGMGIIVTLAFVVILGALAAAGYFMLRSTDDSSSVEANEHAKRSRMARALAVRIGVSVVLFLGILLAWAMGWIAPTGIPITKP
jgi:uncharacterized membrane protein